MTISVERADTAAWINKTAGSGTSGASSGTAFAAFLAQSNAAESAAPLKATGKTYPTASVSAVSPNETMDAVVSGTGATSASLEDCLRTDWTDIDMAPLMMPTAHNIDALRQDISSKMGGFLSAAGIPEAPASITYDAYGKPQFPDDYPYKEQFTKALDDDPAFARELSTVNALAGSAAALSEAGKFSEEYTNAKSAADVQAVLNRYAHLFDNVPERYDTALNFTSGGALSITVNGKDWREAATA